MCITKIFLYCYDNEKKSYSHTFSDITEKIDLNPVKSHIKHKNITIHNNITMNGYIYVREQESYNVHNVYKMGKASNIVERDGTYATGEFNRGSFVRVIEVRIDEMSRIEICLQDRLKNIGL